MVKSTYNDKVMKMTNKDDFAIDLSLEELKIIQSAFKYVIEHKKDIPIMDNHALSSIEDLSKLVKKLEAPISDDLDEKVSIPMTFQDWVAYTSYVEYAKEVIPTESERFILEDLADVNDEMEVKGLVPFI